MFAAQKFSLGRSGTEFMHCMLLPYHLTHPHTCLAHALKEKSIEQRPASEDTASHLASLLADIVQEIGGFQNKSGTLD